jgi:hypothetical protein
LEFESHGGCTDVHAVKNTNVEKSWDIMNYNINFMPLISAKKDSK